MRIIRGAIPRALSAATITLAVAAGPALPAWAGAGDYWFETAGTPETGPDGASLITVRLSRRGDGSPVPGAVLFRVKADMGPAGMAAMAAPARLVGEVGPGLYRIEVQQNMAGAWAIHLSAKVQGEMETVRGTITATLGR